MARFFQYFSLIASIVAIFGCIYLFVTFPSNPIPEQKETRSQAQINIENKLDEIFKEQQMLGDSISLIHFDSTDDRASLQARLALTGCALTLANLCKDVVMACDGKSHQDVMQQIAFSKLHVEKELERAKLQRNEYVAFSANAKTIPLNPSILAKVDAQIERIQSLY